MTVKKFEDLRIWQAAIQLDADIYYLISVNKSMRRDFALRDQMSRSVGSISDNIAEGYERGGKSEFNHFLTIAKASCGELRSQVHRCIRRGHLDQASGEKYIQTCVELASSIAALAKYVRTSEHKGEKFKK